MPTSFTSDGTRQGFAIDITRSISEATNIPVIASSEAENIQHFIDANQSLKNMALV